MKGTLSRRDLLRRGASGAAGALIAPALLNTSSQGAAAAGASLTALWVAFDPLLHASQRLFRQFSAHTGTPIVVHTVPFSDWDRTIRATPQQPSPPDLMIIDGPSVEGYAANGLLRPLDDVFSHQDYSDFTPGTTKAAFWKGKFYGPATNDSSQALFYNKRILDKYGIKPPTELKDAWTWKQAREIFLHVQKAERAARHNDQFWALYIGQGGALGGGTYTGADMIRSNGVPGSPTFKAVSDDGLHTNGYINTPEAVEAYQFLQNLYIRDRLVPSSTTPDFFYNEQIAFWLSTPVYIDVIKANNRHLQWGLTPQPYHKTPIVQTDSFHIGVSAFSKNGHLAAQLVAYLASPKGALSLARDQGVIPCRKSLISDFPGLNKLPLKIFADTVRFWAQPRPITPGFSEYDTVYQQMLVDMATGTPVKQRADAAAAQIDRQLARYARLVH